MIRGFGPLHLRRFREHPGRSTMSLAGIAVGSMLVVTMLGLFGSLTGSVGSIADLAGRADLEVSGSTDAGVDSGVLAGIRATPGVAAAVPIVRAPVTVGDRSVLLLGGDPADGGGLDPDDAEASAPKTGGVGTVQVEGVPVAVGSRLAAAAGLRAGSSFEVFGGGRATTATVIGVIDCDDATALNDGAFLATSLPGADAFTGRRSRVDSIFVRAAARTDLRTLEDRLRETVGGQAIVASPQLRVELAKKGLAPLQQGLMTAISLAFVVAGFLVYNTMSMAALERRRELATLRAIGGRRRPLLLGFLAEAALLGVVGSSVGAVVGVFLARASLGGVPTIVLDYLGVRPSFHLPPSAVPLGIGLGTAATVLAALFPARQAVRVAPVEAMRPEGTLEAGGDGGRTRVPVVVVGIVLFLVGNLLCVVGSGSLVMAGFGTITLGTVVGTAGATGALARGVGWLAWHLFGSTGRLAAAGIERAPRRIWATCLAVTIAVGITIALGGIAANQETSFTEDFLSLADTDLWVQTGTPDTVPVQPLLPDGWVDRIAAVPGVAAVTRDQAAYMTLGDEQILIEGMGPGTQVPFYANAGSAGDRVLAGDGMIASKAWTDRHGHGIGTEVTLETPSGPRTDRIAAIVDLPVVVQGQLGIDNARFTEWFGRAALTGIEVDVADGADEAAVVAGIRAIVREAPTTVHVYTGEEVLAGSLTSLRQSLAIFNLMVWVVVGATGLAILNTMAISVVERRRELGILRAVGTSRRTIRRMVLAEAAAITIAGSVLGFALGLAQHRVGVAAVAGLVGFSVDYHFVVAPMVIATIAAVVMALAGSVGPASRAGKVDVISAIGYE